MERKELQELRWTKEQAESYRKEKLGVVKGINYVPAYCFSYIEMWQNFREEEIIKELKWAAAIGINSLRIFMAACQWQTRKEETYRNIDRFLDIAKELGFTVMLTFQPNLCVEKESASVSDNPFLINFRYGVHDGSWKYENALDVAAKDCWQTYINDIFFFVKETVSRYSVDDRVTIFDLYNEASEKAAAIIETVFSAARDAKPIQPLTACWRALDLCDITTVHCYEQPGNTELCSDPALNFLSFHEENERALLTKRPVLVTECLARTFGNELKYILPYYSKLQFGFYVWGLCAGSAQYHFPWHWPQGSPEPDRWFHCLLYPDGRAYDPEEIVLLKEFGFK